MGHSAAAKDDSNISGEVSFSHQSKDLAKNTNKTNVVFVIDSSYSGESVNPDHDQNTNVKAEGLEATNTIESKVKMCTGNDKEVLEEVAQIKSSVSEMAQAIKQLTNAISPQPPTTFVYLPSPAVYNAGAVPTNNHNFQSVPTFGAPYPGYATPTKDGKKCQTKSTSLSPGVQHSKSSSDYDLLSHAKESKCTSSKKGNKKNDARSRFSPYKIGKKLKFSPSDGSTKKETANTKSKDVYIGSSRYLPKDKHPASSPSGLELPSYIKVTFRPKKDMNLNQVQLAIAAYIFGEGKDSDERLVGNEFGDGHRRTFHTLIPRCCLIDDVIILTASMLTHDERQLNTTPSIWWIPTTFSQHVLSWTTSPATCIKYYKNSFMGRADWVDKALYLEEMLQDECFYELDSFRKHPVISDFPFIEPHTGQQENGSNDCGVWVASWMRSAFDKDPYAIQINDNARMRLAVDLVVGDYNPTRNEIIRLAMGDLKRLEEKRP